MAVRRSSRFDPHINHDLLSSLEKVAGTYAPYDVELFSGYRPHPSRPGSQHGPAGGGAIDFNLIDRKTGRALPNFGTAESATPYQQFVNTWYQSLTPEQQQQARWGGYFNDGGKDWMHVDFGGADKMGAGSWAGGFGPERMQQLKLAASGGLGDAAQAQATQAVAAMPPDVQRAFLSTIAGTESPGYDVMYGGGKFNDYSQHPHAKIPIMSGPNKGDYSSAAGRYQFLGSTWDEQAKKYGYTDFKPETQDKAAWQYAGDVYKQKTGGSLEEALQSGDPGRINAAGQVLSSVWTSLPGGVEQAKGYGTGTFADAFAKNLGAGGPRGPVEAAGGGAGSDSPYKAGTAPAASPVNGFKGWLKNIGKGIGKLDGSEMAMGQMPAVNSRPLEAARIDQPETPTIDPKQVEMQRQQLAQALARLNSGRLV